LTECLRINRHRLKSCLRSSRQGRLASGHSRQFTEGSANAIHGELRLLLNERGIQPKHAIPKAPKHAIATRIGNATPRVILAIDFNDELNGGCYEIRDKAAPDRHLPAKPNAQLARIDARPEQLFGARHAASHLLRMKFDPRLTLKTT
jgi:hypothetical protein